MELPLRNNYWSRPSRERNSLNASGYALVVVSNRDTARHGSVAYTYTLSAVCDEPKVAICSRGCACLPIVVPFCGRSDHRLGRYRGSPPSANLWVDLANS